MSRSRSFSRTKTTRPVQQDIVRVFKEVDLDGDGTIDAQELGTVLAAAKYKISDDYLSGVIDIFGGGTGVLNVQQFAVVWDRMNLGSVLGGEQSTPEPSLSIAHQSGAAISPEPEPEPASDSDPASAPASASASAPEQEPEPEPEPEPDSKSVPEATPVPKVRHVQNTASDFGVMAGIGTKAMQDQVYVDQPRQPLQNSFTPIQESKPQTKGVAITESPMAPDSELLATTPTWLRELFRVFDVNGDGVLDLAEMTTLLGAMGYESAGKPLESVAHSLILRFGQNKTGSITEIDFLNVAEHIHLRQLLAQSGMEPPESPRDGQLLTDAEHRLVPLLQNAQESGRPLTLSQAFGACDNDGDGVLDENEVASLIDALGYDVSSDYLGGVLDIFGAKP